MPPQERSSAIESRPENLKAAVEACVMSRYGDVEGYTDGCLA